MRHIHHRDEASKGYRAATGVSDHALAVGTYVILVVYAALVLIAVFGSSAHH